METFAALLAISAVNSPVPVEFPTQRPVTRSFDELLIYARINVLVNKGKAGDLRRHRTHYDVIVMKYAGFDKCSVYINTSHWPCDNRMTRQLPSHRTNYPYLNNWGTWRCHYMDTHGHWHFATAEFHFSRNKLLNKQSSSFWSEKPCRLMDIFVMACHIRARVSCFYQYFGRVSKF